MNNIEWFFLGWICCATVWFFHSHYTRPDSSMEGEVVGGSNGPK